MAMKNILAELDAEIARLQQGKALLAASNGSAPPAIRRGRPAKTAVVASVTKPGKKKRNLSPEGRARIAEAVKRRWATQKAKSKKA